MNHMTGFTRGIHLTLCVIILSAFSSVAQQQGVSINPDGSSPDPSAILDVQSTSQGFVPPRMTSVLRDAIANPVEGLVIYNTDLRCLQFNRGYPSAPEWVCSDGTQCSPLPQAPQAGAHEAEEGQIAWQWQAVPQATGYRYGLTSNPDASTDVGTTTSFLQTGLPCNQSHTLYVWAYNGCGLSSMQMLQQSTSACGPCLQQPTVADAQGNTYAITEIAGRCWMAENLRTSVHSLGLSYCYNDVPANCTTYGRLYNWAAVMQGASSTNAVPSAVQGICPSGWHVPSDAEWIEMEGTIDGVYGPADPEWLAMNAQRGSDAGTKLKSSGTWDGTNTTGFSALPGGYRHQSNGYILQGTANYFWTSTDDGTLGYRRALYGAADGVFRNANAKTRAMSVRCVKN